MYIDSIVHYVKIDTYFKIFPITILWYYSRNFTQNLDRTLKLFAKSKYCKNLTLLNPTKCIRSADLGQKERNLVCQVSANTAAAYISVTTAFNSRKKKAVIVTAVFSFPAVHDRVKAALDESFTEQVD